MRMPERVSRENSIATVEGRTITKVAPNAKTGCKKMRRIPDSYILISCSPDRRLAPNPLPPKAKATPAPTTALADRSGELSNLAAALQPQTAALQAKTRAGMPRRCAR